MSHSSPSPYLGRLVEVAARGTLYRSPNHPYTKALMVAVPEPNQAVQRAKRYSIVSGEPPSATDIPSGCAFHARCPLATELCRRVSPEVTPHPDGARVACHHA